MYLSPTDYDYGYHINSEMWFYTNSNDSQWVETGLRNGFDASDPCDCVAYEAFWADIDSSHNEHRRTIVNTSPNGTSHNYEVQRGSSTNYWNIYYDYNYVGTSTVTGSWTGYDDQAGAEISNLDLGSDVAADDFDMYMPSQSTTGTWYYWPSRSGYVTYPCGSTYTHPNCFDFVAYHTYEWSWHKSNTS